MRELERLRALELASYLNYLVLFTLRGKSGSLGNPRLYTTAKTDNMNIRAVGKVQSQNDRLLAVRGPVPGWDEGCAACETLT